MLNTQEFGDFLQSVGLKDFVGVPCSYLSPLINYAINENRFVMSNNEGDAVAIASGISLNNSTTLSKSNPAKAESSKSKTPTYGIVLMQNSGLSNALSPLTSLNYTFRIPILGFVSLRGERNYNGKNTDEPQHELLGVITDKLLETCKISYAFLDSEINEAKMQVLRALEIMDIGDSFFFIVRDKTFSKVGLLDSKHLVSQNHSNISESSKDILAKYNENAELSNLSYTVDSNDKKTHLKHADILCGKTQSISNEVGVEKNCILSRKNALPTRLLALELIHSLALKSNALLLATTGKCGRELYEIGDTHNQLYMVGSMGCVSALALGISLKTDQKVIAIDGDSALLMRLGTLSTNAYYSRGNFCHILLDNESHDSTGGQFNLSPYVSFPAIARACGYTHVYETQNLEELEVALKEFLCDVSCENTLYSVVSESNLNNHEKSGGYIIQTTKNMPINISTKYDEKTQCEQTKTKANSYFISLKIAKGSKDNLGRPKVTPQDVALRLNAYICDWKMQNKD